MSHYIILVVIVRYIFRAGGEKCVFAVCFCLHFLYVIENKMSSVLDNKSNFKHISLLLLGLILQLK